MPEDIKAARTIERLINQTWAAAGSEKGAILANHLEFVLGRYKTGSYGSVPPTTIWLANEIIVTARSLFPL